MDPTVEYMDPSEGVIVIHRHIGGNVYRIHERRPSKALVEGKPYVVIMSELFYDLAEEARNGGC